MNKKEYYGSIIVFAILSVGFVASKYILEYNLDWLIIFIIIFVAYLYLRYRLMTPIQRFSNKFNMLVDYDLDLEGAIQLCLDNIEEAPTRGIKALFQVHLGMAYYNNGEYDQALQAFNEVEFAKLNTVYHVLIFAHQAYIYNELGQKDEFDAALERIKNIKGQINRKYLGYANSYEHVLTVIGNLQEDPEEYKQVIESSFSTHSGYVTQRLIYHYRLAKYYEAIGNDEEMDIQLAKVLANGKGHFTAKEAHKMFKNTVNVDDYIFTDEELEPEEPVDILPEEDPGLLEEPKEEDFFESEKE